METPVLFIFLVGVKKRGFLSFFFMEECNIKMKIIMKRMPNSENFEKNNIFSKSFLNLKMISRIQTIL